MSAKIRSFSQNTKKKKEKKGAPPFFLFRTIFGRFTPLPFEINTPSVPKRYPDFFKLNVKSEKRSNQKWLLRFM
jgi:hypothetical protein